MATFYRFFLTIVALSLAVAVFLIKAEVHFLPLLHHKLQHIPAIFSYLTYMAICIFLAWLSLSLAKGLSNDTLSQGSIKEIEQANDAFLPSYLGYFFVALSVPNFQIFCIVFAIIVILIFFSRAAYFNPLYFLFGFRFYYVVTARNVKILIISKRKLKTPEEASFSRIKRVNDFTFLDLESKR